MMITSSTGKLYIQERNNFYTWMHWPIATNLGQLVTSNEQWVTSKKCRFAIYLVIDNFFSQTSQNMFVARFQNSHQSQKVIEEKKLLTTFALMCLQPYRNTVQSGAYVRDQWKNKKELQRHLRTDYTFVFTCKTENQKKTVVTELQ